MREYTQSELEDLIACRKVVTEPPRREMRLEGSQRRNDMWLRSETGEREFRVFLRMHEEFNENFSIGLAYLPKDGSGELILVRCNGPHGEYNANFDPAHPHTEFHVHRATEEAILAGLRPEKFAEKTQYASYREALQYFIRLVGIVDASLHFPDEGQTIFPFLEEVPLQ